MKSFSIVIPALNEKTNIKNLLPEIFRVINESPYNFEVIFILGNKEELIINEANELLRNRDLQESSAAIAFLNTEIPKSSLITMKEAINKLVESQLQKQMMSKVNKEYILKIIDPPFTPEEKSKPTRSLICIFGTLLGGILAIVWVLVRHYLIGRMKSDLNT